MPYGKEYIDLSVNNASWGFMNFSTIHYRHFFLDPKADYNLTLEVMIGNPDVYVKISNTPVYPNSGDTTSYDYTSLNTDQNSEFVNLTYQSRLDNEVLCETAGYHLAGGS